MLAGTIVGCSLPYLQRPQDSTRIRHLSASAPLDFYFVTSGKCEEENRRCTGILVSVVRTAALKLAGESLIRLVCRFESKQRAMSWCCQILVLRVASFWCDTDAVCSYLAAWSAQRLLA